ncbi:RNA-binding protein, partial [Candidatus Woesearchaeota archaeon CG10_big_fil_rev_8_21_14_0_10_34_8]
MITKAAKEHLIASLDAGVRLDGRKIGEYRPIEVKYGVSKTAEGY